MNINIFMTLGLISDLDPAVVANLDLDARASYDGVESEIARSYDTPSGNTG